MQADSAAASRDATLKTICDIIVSDQAPNTLSPDTVHRITLGLQDPLARDRAMSLIYPGEVGPSLALWNHAAQVGEKRGNKMYTAPLHTLRAWMYWVSGNHLSSRRAVHSALAVDPTYRLARLFQTTLAVDEAIPARLMAAAIEDRNLHPEGRMHAGDRNLQ